MHAKIITQASLYIGTSNFEKSLMMLVTLWVTYFKLVFSIDDMYVVNELISSY